MEDLSEEVAFYFILFLFDMYVLQNDYHYKVS